MGRIDKLAEAYERHISLPWQKDLAGAQRVIFLIYDKADERKLRARMGNFEIATGRAGHQWLECDITRVFSDWMAALDYRESYFEEPEDLDLKVESELPGFTESLVKGVLEKAGENTVTAIYGVASLYGFVSVSELMKRVEPFIKGRLIVFFPGEHEDNNYRLLGARDGWNYLAVPITAFNGGFER
ncbi:MAG: DUF1788 domain-containing protein [Thermovirgaceae bacterium]|nr:DUF1788 domain-containing protein [Thermovirgaceae bacterium]